MNERRHTREGGLIMQSCNATRRWRWVSLSVITRQFVERKSESKMLSFQINRAVKAAHALETYLRCASLCSLCDAGVRYFV